MEIAVTARHFQVPATLKGHAEERARRFARVLEPIGRVQIILAEPEERQFQAEIILSATGGNVLVSTSLDVSGPAAVDAASSAMERQLEKFKEKIHRRHLAVHRRVGKAGVQEPANLAD